MSTAPARARVNELARPLREFLDTETASATLLLAATAIALAWANSPAGDVYEDLWGTELSVTIAGAGITEDLRHWVNDGLMVFFFYVVGLEIRRELDMGELRDKRAVAVPALAAVGGMVVPAALYLVFNLGGDGAPGWGIPMATDIAFALGVLAVLGDRCPPSLRVFLLTLAIVDDIGAITVIAIFYSKGVSLAWLAVAAAGIVLVLALRALQVWRAPAYFAVGLLVWVAMHESGVHPTLAGVLIGVLTSAHPPRRRDVARAIEGVDEYVDNPSVSAAREAKLRLEASVSTNERVQHLLHPWTGFVVIPIFALANAGIVINGAVLADALRSPVFLGIIAGLVAGKVLGVALGTAIAVRLGPVALPDGVSRTQVIGAGALAGIGFTVALFITDLAFDDPVLVDQAKLGVLVASVLAAVIGLVGLRAAAREQGGG